MNLIEAYSYLFSDTILSAMILPIYSELVFDTMKIFGNYNSLLMIIIASLGGLVGNIINWLLGNVLISVKKISINPSPDYSRLQSILNDWQIFIMFGYFIPIIGSLLVVLTGFFRISLKKIVIIILPVNIIIYSIKLMIRFI